MAIPTLSRTWQFQVNQQVLAQGSSLGNARRMMRSIKDALLGTGSWTDSAGNATTATNNWTCSGSSSGAASGMDGTDLWTTVSNLNWHTPGNSHSWIVLRQTAISAKFEIVIDLNSSSTEAAGVFMSPSAGFGTVNGGTNGSTTARPTATDEVTVFNGNWGNSSSDGNQRWHVIKSNLGRATRVLVTKNTWCQSMWAIEQPGSSVTGWNNPCLGFGVGANTGTPTSSALTYANLANSAVVAGRGNAAMTMYLTGEGIRTGTTLIGERMTSVNDVSGLYLLAPIGLYSDTASNKGRHGTIADLWWGTGNLSDGTTYPLDGTRQFVQVGGLVLPWNRSNPIFI